MRVLNIIVEFFGFRSVLWGALIFPTSLLLWTFLRPNFKIQFPTKEIMEESVAIRAAIVEANNIRIKVDNMLELWRKTHLKYFAVFKSEHYDDHNTEIISRHCTLEEAKKAMPEDSKSICTPCTYSVIEQPTARLTISDLEKIFTL